MSTAIHRVLLCVLALVAGTAQAQTQPNFTSVVVFGDSLSDTGNIAHLVGSANPLGIRFPADNQLLGFNYTDGRFTDGKDTQPPASAYQGVWIEQLAASFPANPPVKDALDGGTNYAYGDATTGNGTTAEMETIDGLTLGIQLHNMGQQVADYLANVASKSAGAPNPQTLYVLWGGADDLYQASNAGANLTTAAQTAITNELTLVSQLAAAGATSFMIPNLPPLGGVPNYATGTRATALNAAAAVFAQGLTQGIATLETTLKAQGITITIYQPDIFGLFGQYAAGPMSAGLANVSDKAQGISGNPDTYLIWDGLHPTTTGHHYAAAAAANLLTPLVGSTTVLAAPAAALAGQPITLTATVTGSTSHIPAGLVTFFSGTTAVGSATLSSSGVGSATITPVAAASPYSLTAVYAGDTTDEISASVAQPLVAVPTAVATTTALTSSSATANPGASVTLTATVTPAVTTFGPVTGTVTFLNGTTALGTATLANGVATYTTTALPTGSLSLTASYAASGVFAGSTSAALTEVVEAPSFTAQLSPTTLTIGAGSSGTTTLTLASVAGYTGALTLSCGSLPAHLSCKFAPSSVTLSAGSSAGQTSTLTIATNASAALALPVRPGAWSAQEVFSASMLMAGTFLLGFRRRLRLAGHFWAVVFVFLSGGAMLGLAGCGAGSSNNAAAGTYTVPVLVTPAAGSSVAAQTVNLSVTVQ